MFYVGWASRWCETSSSVQFKCDGNDRIAWLDSGSRAHFDGDVCFSDGDRIENMTQHYQLLIVAQRGFKFVGRTVKARQDLITYVWTKALDSVIIGHWKPNLVSPSNKITLIRTHSKLTPIQKVLLYNNWYVGSVGRGEGNNAVQKYFHFSNYFDVYQDRTHYVPLIFHLSVI